MELPDASKLEPSGDSKPELAIINPKYHEFILNRCIFFCYGALTNLTLQGYIVRWTGLPLEDIQKAATEGPRDKKWRILTRTAWGKGGLMYSSVIEGMFKKWKREVIDAAEHDEESENDGDIADTGG